MQVMVKRVEGAAAANAATLQRRVAELEASLGEARREVSTLRTAAGSEESKAAALEKQLEQAHRKALSEVESERARLQVGFYLSLANTLRLWRQRYMGLMRFDTALGTNTLRVCRGKEQQRKRRCATKLLG